MIISSHPFALASYELEVHTYTFP